jgi:hypothetical protein
MTDPNVTHPQYNAMIDRWTKCRDTYRGLPVVQSKGSTYLPRLGGQVNDADPKYQKYIQRAQFFDAVSRTVDTMAGHIFRKQPVIELTTALQAYQGDIDMAGTSLEGFISNAVREVALVNRMGLLVEHPQRGDDNEGVLTIEQSRAQGLRPYLTSYKAEDILNWRMGRVNNATVLVQVFLSETYDEGEGEEVQIRELALEDRYVQRIWRENDGKWYVESETFPSINGRSINKIPFFFVGLNEKGADTQKPPLEGLADVCLGYYRNSADYEAALHIHGAPTPWINGVSDPESFGELHLGSGTVLMLPVDATAGMLQAGSDGCAALKEAMQEKKQEMAALGAQMLKADKAMAESGQALAIQRGGENSILASLAASVEMTFSKALRFMAEWVGANPDEVVVTLNKDYLPQPMDSAMLREWTAAYLSGAISFDTYFEGLLQGELVDETLTVDEERDRKEMDAPALGLIGDGLNDNQ